MIINRVYVSILSEEDSMSRRVYVCRREHWDKMTPGEQALEMIDRLAEEEVYINPEDANGDEITIKEGDE